MSENSSSSGSSMESHGSSEDLTQHYHQMKTSLSTPSPTSKSSVGASTKTNKPQRSIASSNKLDQHETKADGALSSNIRRSRSLQSCADSDVSSHSSASSNAGEYIKESAKATSVGEAGKQHHVVKVVVQESREFNKGVGEDGVIYFPQASDILLGRGKGVSETAGNIRFQRLVESHADRYIATARQSRGEYCGTIVRQAQEDWGARFLEPASGGGWKLADLDKARKKVGQAVRYRLRQLPDALPTKKSKILPAPSENKPSKVHNKVSRKADELAVLEHDWNHAVSGSHASSSGALCPLALLGSVAAASSGIVLATDPQQTLSVVVPCVEKAKASDNSVGLETDEDRLAEEKSHKSSKNTKEKYGSQKASNNAKDVLDTIHPSSSANVGSFFGGTWLSGTMANHTWKPLPVMPINNIPNTEQGELQCRNVSSSASSDHEDETNISDNEHKAKINDDTKRSSLGGEIETVPLHKKQKTSHLPSLDNLAMDDCIRILSSVSSTMRCSAEDVNHALRSLRRQVVDSAEDENSEADAGWRFVCLLRGIPLVIRCMSVFAAHAGIQSNACFLLSELLRLSDKKQSENGSEASYSIGLIMQASGVIEAVLHAMREHCRDRLVNNNALAMLSTFTRELKRPLKELERTLVSQCVVPQVLLALQTFGTEFKIARHAGNILWNLSMDSPSRSVMVEAGAATIVSLAILQVPREFKAQFTSLHLRILQDYFYHGVEDDDEERYSFHPAAIMSSVSPFQKR